MKKYKNFIFFLFLMMSILPLMGGGIFDPKGVIAQAQKDLILTSVILMLIVIIPVFILTFYFAYKYNEKNSKAKYDPEWSHNTKLEVVWWGIPIIIIIILAIITWKSSHELDPYKPLENQSEKPIVIQVVSLNWKWLFIYPEQKIATLNYIKVPTGTPIAFELTSDAPMNSFWMPQLAGQIYTMPGMETKLHIVVTENGKYNGMSANYSGYGFSGMSFIVDSTNKNDFEQWVADVKKSSNKSLNNNSYIELSKFTLNNNVEYFGDVKDGLFHDILMKYMSPQKSDLIIDIMSESNKYNNMKH